MTDNSNIALRWEIDNATASLATGKAESGVFNEGGFKWTVEINRRAALIDFALRCGVDHNGPWKCDVEMDIYALYSSGRFYQMDKKHRFCFEDVSSDETFPTNWQYAGIQDYMINEKATFEFRIHIINFERGQPIADTSIFDSPNRMSNVILKIGEKKVHVYKEFMAFHSPFFEALFFGDFSDNGKEEVEIKDVVYEEFINLLNYIRIGTGEITDRTVGHILKLADQFQMECVIEQSKKHLTQSKGFDVVKKLQFADQYKLDTLRVRILLDHCLNSFTTVAELVAKVKSSPEYVNFSLEMKGAICDRIMKF